MGKRSNGINIVLTKGPIWIVCQDQSFRTVFTVTVDMPESRVPDQNSQYRKQLEMFQILTPCLSLNKRTRKT